GARTAPRPSGRVAAFVAASLFWSGCAEPEPPGGGANPFSSAPAKSSAPAPPRAVTSRTLSRPAYPGARPGSGGASRSALPNGRDAGPLGANGCDDTAETKASRIDPALQQEIEDLTREIGEKPRDLHILYNNRGIAYYNAGELEKALADLTKAIELNTRYAEAWEHRGIVHETLGDKASAEADYARAAMLNRSPGR
ncbi:MAG: tetratricopeptide repeat protein, partial [Planctomycetes bacterium]|nr:tetratricopeptide repeat protein [Planctomycetota bacterium]